MTGVGGFGHGPNGLGIGGNPMGAENISDCKSIKFKKHGFIKVITTLYMGSDEDKATLIYNM
jgi:hypothetical protein